MATNKATGPTENESEPTTTVIDHVGHPEGRMSEVWYADCRKCGVAFQSSAKQTTCGKCYLRLKEARREADRRRRTLRGRVLPSCSVCGLNGHNKSTCPAVQPSTWKFNPWSGEKIE